MQMERDLIVFSKRFLLMFKLPAIMILFFPMAVLFATMLVLVRMAKDNEISELINISLLESLISKQDKNFSKKDLSLFDLMIENTSKLRYNINLKLYYEFIMLKMT